MNFLSGGLWIIPLATFLGALYSFYRGYKQSKSGSLEDGGGGSSVESNINVPFWKTTATVYGYILTVFTFVILLIMYNDK
jgi:hypothetical protein